VVITVFGEPPQAKKPLRYSDHPIAIRLSQARCKPWPHTRHCRRRFHKAFFKWYAANEQKFSIKLELLKRTDRSLDVGFCNISRVVKTYVGDTDIAIPIDWNDAFWDIIQWFEARPKRVPGGYVCDLCPEGNRPVYSSREEIWRIEIFERFLTWVNNDLAKAESVFVSGNPNSMTWARLKVNTRQRPPSPC
jgi:hypothetical protein